MWKTNTVTFPLQH